MRWAPSLQRLGFASGSAPSLAPSAPAAPTKTDDGRRARLKPVSVTGSSESADAHKRSLGWQDELWEFAEDVGELGFIITFYENCGRRARLVAAWRDDGGGTPTVITGLNPKDLAPGEEPAPGEALLSDQDVIAQDVASSIKARLGGQQALMAKAMANIPHIGDCWLLATETTTKMTGEREIEFETLSISELFEDQQQEGKRARALMRKRLPNQSAKKLCEIDEDGRPKPVETEETTTVFSVVRIWEPDHRFSDMAYSSLKAVRQTLRVIRLCDLALSTMLDARAHLHGILLWPDDVGVGPDRITVSSDDEVLDDDSSFLDDLVKAATERKRTHGSPASLFPFVVPIPKDRIAEGDGGPRLLEWGGKFESTVAELRDASVTRLAQQTDLPVSVVTGESGNRWSDFVVKQTLFQAHLAPKFEMIVSAITEQLYVGLLAAEFQRQLGMTEDDALDAAAQYCLWFDASGLIVNPDRTADADLAFDRFAISQSAYLRAKGFDENDAPNLEELQRQLALSVVRSSPAVGAKLLSLVGLPAFDPDDPDYRPDIVAALTTPEPAGNGTVSAPSTEVTGRAGEPPRKVTPVTNPDEALSAYVRAAVHGALCSAGTHLLNAAKSRKGTPSEAALLSAVPPAGRLAAIGWTRAQELGFDLEALRFEALDLANVDAKRRAALEVYGRSLVKEAAQTGVIPEVVLSF